MREIEEADWRGLYREGWGSEITREAVAHPAKFARALIRRIYEYAFAQGYLRPGDSILDPFGGVGLGAADAIRLGLRWTGIELEPKFVSLGQGCDCSGFTAADWRQFFGRPEAKNRRDGRPLCPRCIADLQYYPARPLLPVTAAWKARRARMVRLSNQYERELRYSEPLPLPDTVAGRQASARQLSLFQGRPAGEEARYERGSGEIPQRDAHHYQGNIERWRGAADAGPGTARLIQGDSRELLDILDAGTDSLSALVSSPPYGDQAVQNGGRLRRFPGKRRVGASQNRNDGYGGTAGQLGTMPAGLFAAAISSPPYINTLNNERHGLDWSKRKRDYPGRFNHAERIALSDRQHSNRLYGRSEGQLGGMRDGEFEDASDTFWGASRLILEQAYAALRPGGVAIWVVKDFIRDGQRVPFTEQWLALCQAVGFTLEREIRAWLVEEYEEPQLDIFEGRRPGRTIERKGIYRRIAERNGAPRIDWETVLIVRKDG